MLTAFQLDQVLSADRSAATAGASDAAAKKGAQGVVGEVCFGSGLADPGADQLAVDGLDLLFKRLALRNRHVAFIGDLSRRRQGNLALLMHVASRMACFLEKLV